MISAFKAESNLAEYLDIYRNNHNTREKVLQPKMTGFTKEVGIFS